MLALSSGNVGKYELLTVKDALPKKLFLERSTEIKWSTYSPLGSELKKQIDIAKDQYQLKTKQMLVTTTEKMM